MGGGGGKRSRISPEGEARFRPAESPGASVVCYLLETQDPGADGSRGHVSCTVAPLIRWWGCFGAWIAAATVGAMSRGREPLLRGRGVTRRVLAFDMGAAYV